MLYNPFVIGKEGARIRKLISLFAVIALFLCLLPSSAFAVLNGGFTDEDIVKELNSIMQWD